MSKKVWKVIDFETIRKNAAVARLAKRENVTIAKARNILKGTPQNIARKLLALRRSAI